MLRTGLGSRLEMDFWTKRVWREDMVFLQECLSLNLDCYKIPYLLIPVNLEFYTIV